MGDEKTIFACVFSNSFYELVFWTFPANGECQGTQLMGLLPDMENYVLRMRRECRESFPRHRRLAIPTWITARASRTHAFPDRRSYNDTNRLMESRQEKGRNDTRDRYSNQWDTDNMTQNLPRNYNCNESNHMVDSWRHRTKVTCFTCNGRGHKAKHVGISGLAMMVVPIVSERALNMYHLTVLRNQISVLWDLVIIISS